MRRFWAQFAALNAPFFVRVLREAARQIELLEPGSPALAYPIIFHDKELSMGQITKKDSDAPFRASVGFVDAVGSPTSPDDVPQWASSDESIATVAADEDGLGATVTPGSPGDAVAATAQVTVTSTRSSDGVVITSVGAVTITSGEAAVGDVEFSDTAEPPPAPAP